MQRILVIGATSAIAKATARLYAAQGARLYLMARSMDHLGELAADLKLRGAAGVEWGVFEAQDMESHGAALDKAIGYLETVDLALIAHGVLLPQRECEQETDVALQQFNVNATSVLSVLTRLANQFEKQGAGTLAVIGSVAGDRGRQSNYVYGAAKGAVSIFLDGLRHRLHASGVHVLTIKPGFVDTPMTAALAKGPLWASPEQVAADIHAAARSGKAVLYTPWFWRPIMWIIRSIPAFVFHRMKL